MIVDKRGEQKNETCCTALLCAWSFRIASGPNSLSRHSLLQSMVKLWKNCTPMVMVDAAKQGQGIPQICKGERVVALFLLPKLLSVNRVCPIAPQRSKKKNRCVEERSDGSQSQRNESNGCPMQAPHDSRHTLPLTPSSQIAETSS